VVLTALIEEVDLLEELDLIGDEESPTIACIVRVPSSVDAVLIDFTRMEPACEVVIRV
jgi:hypothetical protein